MIKNVALKTQKSRQNKKGGTIDCVIEISNIPYNPLLHLESAIDKHIKASTKGMSKKEIKNSPAHYALWELIQLRKLIRDKFKRNLDWGGFTEKLDVDA